MITDHKLLYEVIEKTILISTQCVRYVDEEDFEKLDSTMAEREKLINIIQIIYDRVLLRETRVKTESNQAFNDQVNQLIAEIMKMDSYILEKLEKEHKNTQIEIAKVFKNKENFKGYNLNCLK